MWARNQEETNEWFPPTMVHGRLLGSPTTTYLQKDRLVTDSPVWEGEKFFIWISVPISFFSLGHSSPCRNGRWNQCTTSKVDF